MSFFYDDSENCNSQDISIGLIIGSGLDALIH